jgi:hypothetical protein
MSNRKSRSTLTALLGVASLILVAACGDSTGNQNTGATPTPAAPSARPNTPSYAGPAAAAKIKVTVPDGWKPVAGASVPAQYTREGRTFVAKTESYAPTELNAIVNQALAAYKTAFANVTVTKGPEATKVDGHEALRIDYQCDVANIRMKYINVFTRVNGQTWVISFGGLGDAFEKYDADYQAILASIRFE